MSGQTIPGQVSAARLHSRAYRGYVVGLLTVVHYASRTVAEDLAATAS